MPIAHPSVRKEEHGQVQGLTPSRTGTQGTSVSASTRWARSSTASRCTARPGPNLRCCGRWLTWAPPTPQPPWLPTQTFRGHLSRHHRGHPRMVVTGDRSQPRLHPGGAPRRALRRPAERCRTGPAQVNRDLRRQQVLILFPGVGALKVIEVSHWPGALITSAKIIESTEPIGYWRQPVAVGGVGRCATPVVTSAGRRLVRFAIGMSGTTWSWGLPRARRGGSEHGTTGRGRSARYASGAAPARYR